MRLHTAGAYALSALIAAAAAAPAGAADAKKADAKAAKGEAKPAAGALATVDGVPITAAQVEARAAGQLAQVRAQEFAIRERALEDLINDQLVQKAAAAAKISTTEFLRQEVDVKAATVSEEEKKNTFERFKGRLGGMSEEDAMKRIEEGLKQQKTEERRQALLKELRAKASVRMLMEPPRTAVSIDPDDPAKGPTDAPVTIVEYSDFQCPFCSRAKDTVDQVVQRYGKHVRLVFRDFPLPFHKEAAKAAEAGQCAADQGKFWEMHDKMFANQSALQVDALKKAAGELGLDGEKFNQCLDSGKYAERVKKDTEAGQAVGVTGTPAFFVNGRMISGAQPIDAFTKIIDDELQRKNLPIPPPAAAEAKAGS